MTRLINLFSITALFLAYIIVPTLSHAENMEKVEPIHLTAHEDIQDAIIVSNAIDKMSSLVMNCIENEIASPAECPCLHKEELDNVKNAYNKAIEKHPNWKDQVIFYTKKNDSYSYNISFGGLRRQLEIDCPE